MESYTEWISTPPTKEWLQKDLPADIRVSMGHLHSDLSDCGTVEANLTFKSTPGGRDPRGGKWKLKKQWRPGVVIDTLGGCSVAVGSWWSRERAEMSKGSTGGSLPLWTGQKSHIHHRNALEIRNRAVCSSLHSAFLAFIRSGFHSKHQNKYRTFPRGWMVRDYWTCICRSPFSHSGFNSEWCWWCWSGGNILMMCLW